MGYDTTSGEENPTGQPRQTQAPSFAGSTAKLQNSLKMSNLNWPPCVYKSEDLSRQAR